MNIPDWPDLPKPELPEGYKWECLRPSSHHWWVRVSWRTKGGRQRMLRFSEDLFATPTDAIRYAVNEVHIHNARRLAAAGAAKEGER
jgi:hypothetical protein